MCCFASTKLTNRGLNSIAWIYFFLRKQRIIDSHLFVEEMSNVIPEQPSRIYWLGNTATSILGLESRTMRFFCSISSISYYVTLSIIAIENLTCWLNCSKWHSLNVIDIRRSCTGISKLSFFFIFFVWKHLCIEKRNSDSDDNIL